MIVEYTRPEQKGAYLERLTKGIGFIANCWIRNGEEKGGTVHRADCFHLAKGGRNPNSETGRPITDEVWKFWAPTIEELDRNAGRQINRCGACLR